MREKEPIAKRGVMRRAIAMVSMAALSLGLVSVTSATAHADKAPVAIDVLHKGKVVSNDAVVPEGDEIQLRVQYDAAQPIGGTQINIELPPEITVKGDLPGNEAIDTITGNGDGTVTVTFKDPIPSGIAEGAFVITLSTESVRADTEAPISWTIGDDKGGVNLVVEHEVPPVTEIIDGYSKSVTPNNLDGFVHIDDAPSYAFLGLKSGITDEVLTYTLVMDSADARHNYEIADELEAGLTYQRGSFVATLNTADGEEAVNFVPAFTGQGFSGVVSVPAQSRLTITYQVMVSDVRAFETELRKRYDARDDVPGDYLISLQNKVMFGGTVERSADVRLRGNIPGVGIGENFAKSGNWNALDVLSNEQGTLLPAAEMEYKLHADLRPWDERNQNFTLKQNVVISDTLIEQASWLTGSDFISVSGDGPIQKLTEAKDFTGDATDFAAKAYIGKYALVGQTLLVNVGHDNETNIDIRVRAALNTVSGLHATPSKTVLGGTQYSWHNRAGFTYEDGQTAERDHNATVVVLPDDYESGVNDSAAFNKTTNIDEVRVSPGERAQVPYRFTIDTAKPQIDPLKSKIVDEVDTTVFDIEDISTLPVSGLYGDTRLDQKHFALSLNKAGHLVIELSDAGKTVVSGEKTGKQWIVDLLLTTVPFDKTNKETFEIYNRASLLGEKTDWDYWSDQKSEATSFGDEAELRKRIYDAETGSWVSNLNAIIEGGEFVAPRFVYSIELIPRGNYGSQFAVEVYPREDVLPASVDFLGFVDVDANGAPLDGESTASEIELNGNLIASYESGAVTVKQKPGTSLDPKQGRIVAYFAVSGNDTSQSIVNTIADSSATIHPVGDPSINIVKWNDEGETPEYDTAGALLNADFEGDFNEAPGKQLAAGTKQQINFTVSNDGREALKQLQVSDALVSGKGAISDLVCEFPDGSTGTEWAGEFEVGAQFDCVATLPALQAGQNHADRASVTAVGVHTGTNVDDTDDWHAFVPAAAASGNGLVNTGASSLLWLGGIALLMLAAGGTVVMRKRRA